MQATPLPAFEAFLARTKLLHRHAAPPTLVKRYAVSAASDAKRRTGLSHGRPPAPLARSESVGSLPPPIQAVPSPRPMVALPSAAGLSHGFSTRRSLLRLAPKQVRVDEDGSPLLPMTTDALLPVKRFLTNHQRCEIVLRVLAGERQAHLTKEFGISRAAVSYLVRHQWKVLAKAIRKP